MQATLLPDKRRYVSPKRSQAAEATRVRIIGAAAKVFARRGYTLATMAEVAADAGVAIDTIYSVVGRKPALFAQAFDATISQEALPTPLEARHYQRLVEQASDPQTLLRIVVGILAEVYGAADRMFSDLEIHAPEQPVLAQIRRNSQRRREVWLRRVVSDLHLREPLPHGPGDAEALLHALLTPAAFRILLRDRGWSEAQLVQRMSDALYGGLYARR